MKRANVNKLSGQMDGCCSGLGDHRIHVADLGVLDVRRAASVARQRGRALLLPGRAFLAFLKVLVDLVEHVGGLAPVRVALDQVQQKYAVYLRASE